MSALLEWQPEKRTWIGEFVLWCGSALAVMAIYAGAALWLAQEEPMAAADNSPPPAIMIELAETPEATQTGETDISQEVRDSAQSAPSEKADEPLDEPSPEKPVEEQPSEPAKPEEVKEHEKPAPVIEQKSVEEKTPLLENVAVPLPAIRPKPPAPKKVVVRKDQPRKTPTKKAPSRQNVASPQATKAQVQVAQSTRTAARQSASGFFSSAMTPATWQAKLMAQLEHRKRYPSGARSRGETGIVYVRFRIDDSGNVLSASLARSSGYPELDNEVLSLVRRASPVPAPPPGVNKTITAPVKFDTRW